MNSQLNNLLLVLIAGGGLAMLLAFAGLGVWLSYRHASRRRELEHIERMKAIESGYPLADQDSTRRQMLGLIGVAVPVAGVAAAAWTTQEVFGQKEIMVPLWLLPVVWGICGLIAIAVGVGAVIALRPRKADWPAAAQSPSVDDVFHR